MAVAVSFSTAKAKNVSHWSTPQLPGVPVERTCAGLASSLAAHMSKLPNCCRDELMLVCPPLLPHLAHGMWAAAVCSERHGRARAARTFRTARLSIKNRWQALSLQNRYAARWAAQLGMRASCSRKRPALLFCGGSPCLQYNELETAGDHRERHH